MYNHIESIDDVGSKMDTVLIATAATMLVLSLVFYLFAKKAGVLPRRSDETKQERAYADNYISVGIFSLWSFTVLIAAVLWFSPILQ